VDDCAVPSSDEGRQELWKYCQAVAGGSLHAAGMLKAYEEGNPSKGEKVINTAINWGGGRHHAHRSMGGGFCWVNDTVLALQLMRRKFGEYRANALRTASLRAVSLRSPLLPSSPTTLLCPRSTPCPPVHAGKVLYLDIDIHHADGVEEAFITSRSVVTVSMHKYGHGFFPGTGGWDKAHGPNNNPGHFHTLNVPLPDHVTDEDFVPFYQETLAALIEGHREHSPTGEFKAVCLAVGADGLHGETAARCSFPPLDRNTDATSAFRCTLSSGSECSTSGSKRVTSGSNHAAPFFHIYIYLLFVRGQRCVYVAVCLP